MEKIAVVQQIEYYTPTVSTLREAENLSYNSFLHVKNLEIGILDKTSGQLKSISSKSLSYNNCTEYKLGDIVLYNEETNKVYDKKYIFEDFTEEEINEICAFFKEYVKKIENAIKLNDKSSKEKTLSILRSLITYLRQIQYTKNLNNCSFSNMLKTGSKKRVLKQSQK